MNFLNTLTLSVKVIFQGSFSLATKIARASKTGCYSEYLLTVYKMMRQLLLIKRLSKRKIKTANQVVILDGLLQRFHVIGG